LLFNLKLDRQNPKPISDKKAIGLRDGRTLYSADV